MLQGHSSSLELDWAQGLASIPDPKTQVRHTLETVMTLWLCLNNVSSVGKELSANHC